jgi:hypothetical protein
MSFRDDLEVLDTHSGTYQRWDPYSSFGRGLPDGCVMVDDASPEQLVAAIPALLRRVDELQRRVDKLESEQKEREES